MFISFKDAAGIDKIISVDASIEETHVSSALVTDHAVEEGSNITDNVRPENDQITIEMMISNTPVSAPGSHSNGARHALTPASLYVSGTKPKLQRRADGNPSMPAQPSPPVRDKGNPITVRPAIPPQSLGSTLAPFGAAAGLAGGKTGATIGLGLLAANSVRTPGVAPIFQAQPLHPKIGQATLPTPQPVQPVDVSGDVITYSFSEVFDRVKEVYNELLRIVKGGIEVKISTSLREYDHMVLYGMRTPRNVDLGNVLRVTVDAKQIRVVTTKTVQVTNPVETRAKVPVNRGNQTTKEADYLIPPGKPNTTVARRLQKDGLMAAIGQIGFNVTGGGE